MLALAGVDALGAVLFAFVYAAGGQRVLAQAAFVTALGVVFAGVTAFWVHTERAPGRSQDPLGRLGRIVGALTLTVVAIPGLVLTPIFALKDSLPAAAGFDDVVRPVMVLVLISLAWVTLVNVAGVCVIGAAAASRWIGRKPTPPA